MWNSAHRDGRIEHPDEEGLVYADEFVAWASPFIEAGDTILDVGCRTGYVTERLAKALPQVRVSGIDVVPEFVKIAVERGVDATVLDMRSPDFPESDWLVISHSLEHCPEVADVAEHLSTMARKGFYVCVPLEPIQDPGCPSHMSWIQDPLGWLNLFESLGFVLYRASAVRWDGRTGSFNFLFLRENIHYGNR